MKDRFDDRPSELQDDYEVGTSLIDDDFKTMPGSTHNECRYRTKGEHLIRLAPKQNAREPASAMRPHDNEVASFVFCGLDDALGWMLVFHV
jgi:hypothetical protein